MRDGMTLLFTYLNQVEGEIALGRLADLGVRAVLATDNCGGMRPHFDLQAGVRLLVQRGPSKHFIVLKRPE